MSKAASIILVSILSLVLLFLGVFSFLTEVPVGDYKIYYAPADLIQLGSQFTSTEKANYTIDTTDFSDEELAELGTSITATIGSRLSSVFSYHNSSISVNESGDRLTVSIPSTTAHDGSSASEILSSVVAVGLVEFIDVNSEEYKPDSALMSNTDEGMFGKASVSEMVNGENRYFIVEVKLTSEGLKKANSSLSHSGSAAAVVALDGTPAYYVYHREATNEVTIYTSSTYAAETLASYFNYGALATDVTLISSAEVANESTALTVVGASFAVLVLALVIALIIKFRVFALPSIMTIITAIIGCVVLAGLWHFEVFNIYAVIGFVLGLALLAYCVCTHTSALSSRKPSESLAVSFKKVWLKMLIACAATLVVGIILWVIPCFVTVSLGNALVYSAVCTLIASFCFSWLYNAVTKPLCVAK